MRKILSFVIVLVLMLGLFGMPVFATDTGPGDIEHTFSVINGLAAYAGIALSILGLLTFVVQVVVEATKRLPLIYKIPTDAWAIFVSLAVCTFTLFGYAGWQGLTMHWYYIGLAIFASLVVSYISMYGWTKLNALYLRYSKRIE